MIKRNMSSRDERHLIELEQHLKDTMFGQPEVLAEPDKVTCYGIYSGNVLVYVTSKYDITDIAKVMLGILKEGYLWQRELRLLYECGYPLRVAALSKEVNGDIYQNLMLACITPKDKFTLFGRAAMNNTSRLKNKPHLLRTDIVPPAWNEAQLNYLDELCYNNKLTKWGGHSDNKDYDKALSRFYIDCGKPMC